MELRQLRYFVALAEEHHFQRAAMRIPLAQSSLSAQIAKLEREVGRSLFVRHARTCELTDAGAVLYRRATRLIAEADQLLATVQTIGRDDRAVTIGMFEEGAAELNAPIVATLRTVFPEVEVHHYDQEAWERLDDATVDLLLGPASDRFASRPLFSDGALLVVARHNELADADHLAATDALAHTPRWIEAPLDVDRAFASWVRLEPERGGPPERTVGDPAMGILELLEQVARDDSAAVVTGATRRFFGRPDVAYVPVPDYHNPVCVLHRATDERPHIRDAIHHITLATQRFIGLLPDATLWTTAAEGDQLDDTDAAPAS